MRDDPQRLRFEIDARDGAARTGRLHTSHGPVETPAFVPLATRGAVRTLSSADVAALGYRLVLGNTFHLFLSPGPERVAELGGLHRFMGWERAIVTDSGGFQVFSMAHGNVADEIKGRRGAAAPSGGAVEISERGVAFRSYVDGSKRFLGPEESMATQAALGSDIALSFDECTPYHADRDYTARSTERTQRWLERSLAWHAEHGPADQAVFGIVQGGVHEDLRRISAEGTAAAAADGLAIGGTLGRDKEQMHGVVELTASLLPGEPAKHLLGIGEPDDLLVGIGIGIDTFDCAVPTRLARHGMALAPLPASRFRFDVARAAYATDEGPLVDGCECATCARHTRAYLHYLCRAEELTAGRMLTIHNLAFLERLLAGARRAIRAGQLLLYCQPKLDLADRTINSVEILVRWWHPDRGM
ncbi:MAG: tRNA guanosine(34) transglycosylase Tgt, partial [Solirubrobacterales bacterium]|nr:tRNA guanosine(34) transglycosylase Tgt [Solirubrobacterales bacterium]